MVQIISMWVGVRTLARGSTIPPMSLLLKDSVAPGVRVTYSRMGIYSFRKTMDKSRGGVERTTKKQPANGTQKHKQKAGKER